MRQLDATPEAAMIGSGQGCKLCLPAALFATMLMAIMLPVGHSAALCPRAWRPCVSCLLHMKRSIVKTIEDSFPPAASQATGKTVSQGISL
jgi:hypothetical protein